MVNLSVKKLVTVIMNILVVVHSQTKNPCHGWKFEIQLKRQQEYKICIYQFSPFHRCIEDGIKDFLDGDGELRKVKTIGYERTFNANVTISGWK
ncbi:hypothetical protein Avbf_03161 [Armadillidium vulgare]|nr:hypothetical protein Avbf_03161 [Armadillidium vulgare]